MYVATTTKPTGAATVSQVISGIGFQPKALVVFMSEATTLNSPASGDLLWSRGFATATEAYCLSGVATTTPAYKRRVSSSKVLCMLDASGTVVAECSLTSMDSDGFTLSWTTNNATAYSMTYIAFDSTEAASAKIVNWQFNTATGNQAVTGAGFTPSCVLHLSAGGVTTLNVTGTVSAGDMLGAMTTSAQWVRGQFQNATAGSRAQLTNACVVSMSLSGSTATIAAQASYVSMDSDGFTVNWSVAGATSNQAFSLCLAGGNYAVGNFDKTVTAATVSQAVTGIGFKPSGVLFEHWVSAASTSPANAFAIGKGAFGGTGEAYNAVNGYPNNYSNTKVVGSVFTGPVVSWEADGASLDSDGFTLSFTTNNATATQILYFAVRGAKTVAPGVASLSTARFAPTTRLNMLPVPTTLATVLASFAPTVVLPSAQTVTPATLATLLASFAPTIVLPKTVTPATLALLLASFAPTVSVGQNVTPATAALVTATFAPTLINPQSATPATLALTLSAFAPVASVGHYVTPDTLALLLTSFAPVILLPQSVTPSTLALLLAGFAPTILAPQSVTPATLALVLTGFEPTVTPTLNMQVTPGPGSLVLATFAPSVIALLSVYVMGGVAILVPGPEAGAGEFSSRILHGTAAFDPRPAAGAAEMGLAPRAGSAAYDRINPGSAGLRSP